MTKHGYVQITKLIDDQINQMPIWLTKCKSNDDMWGTKMTICIVYHLTTSQKKCWSKTLVKGTTLRLVKKIIPIVLDLLKSTWFKRPKGFFDTYHFGGFLNHKTWFEKPRILLMCSFYWTSHDKSQQWKKSFIFDGFISHMVVGIHMLFHMCYHSLGP
jgi:hypothetical protein